jgi:hypothetical protein
MSSNASKATILNLLPSPFLLEKFNSILYYLCAVSTAIQQNFKTGEYIIIQTTYAISAYANSFKNTKII